MNLTHLTRTLLITAALGATGAIAHAEGDQYSRLAMMREMDANKDGLISKEEFLDKVSKLWDMRADAAKAKDGMMTMKQVQAMESSIGKWAHQPQSTN